MPQLDKYFSAEANGQYDHPLLRFLSEMKARPDFQNAMVEVIRPRAPLGYKPAKLYLYFYGKSGKHLDGPHAEDWDDELNTALIRCKVRAVTVDNEKTRFSLGLGAALQRAETRFGDGYYNSALMYHILHSPLKDHAALAEVLPHIYRSDIDPTSRSYNECREMIDGAIRGRAAELTNLGYEIPEGEDILATAIAQYLDDRFSVTNRRVIGLL